MDTGIDTIRTQSQRLAVPFDLGLIRKAPGFEVPDIEGTVEGWRVWTTSRDVPPFGVDPKLHSATHFGYCWYPQQTAEAECSRDHVPAHKTCTCGFYSAKSLQRLLTLPYPHYDGEDDTNPYVTIMGRVANWGQVTEASYGWRSQYSYPVMLFVPYEAAKLAKPLMKAFGCKVRLLNWLKDPGELDQIAAVQGEYKVKAAEDRKMRGLRCHHLTLPFKGYLASDIYQKDGEPWVKVRWNGRDQEVPMRVSNLRIDRVAR